MRLWRACWALASRAEGPGPSRAQALVGMHLSRKAAQWIGGLVEPEPELERPATFAPTVTEKANPSRNSGSH